VMGADRHRVGRTPLEGHLFDPARNQDVSAGLFTFKQRIDSDRSIEKETRPCTGNA
jgi:hypothetical protein